MQCPACRAQLETVEFSGLKIEKCPSCGGLWFDDHELAKAQRNNDPFLGYLHQDPWEDPKKFKLEEGTRVCPEDGTPLYRARYDGTNIIIDVCQKEHGLWLDKGEWEAIGVWMRQHLAEETAGELARHLAFEIRETASGHDTVSEELQDMWAVTKLLSYRFLAKIPGIALLISELPT